MKHWQRLAVGVLALIIAGCGAPQTGSPAAADPTTSGDISNPEDPGTTDQTSEAEVGAEAGPAATAWNCGDPARLGQELHIFSWADYVPEEPGNNLLQEFGDACGVRVSLDTYPTNEDLAAKIRAGNSGYDLIIPSDYMVDILRQEGRLLKLDKSLLPNIRNLDPHQMGLPFDPENDYSLPYQYGLTGIAYDSSRVDPAPDSWADLFEPTQVEQYSNQVSMLDDERESVGAALRWLGHSYNSTDPAELAQAREALLRQKPHLASYDSENVANTLASGEVLLAHAWNGAASLARSENPNIEWIVPREGGVIWQDNLAIPVDAPEPYTAQIFMNNLLDAAIGARITEYTYFLTPNMRAQELLSEEVRELQFYPDDETRGRLEWIERTGDPTLYADIWTEVKGQ